MHRLAAWGLVLALASGGQALAATKHPGSSGTLVVRGHVFQLAAEGFERQPPRKPKVPTWIGSYVMAGASAPGSTESTGSQSATTAASAPMAGGAAAPEAAGDHASGAPGAAIPSPDGDPSPDGRTRVTAGVFFFASVDQAREMLSNPVGVAAIRDLKGQIPLLDEVYGLEASGSGSASSSSDSAPAPLREVRGRRGAVVMTFVQRSPDEYLVPFVAAFLSQAGRLSTWSEPAATLSATQGKARSAADLSLDDQGILSGTLKLKPKGALTLDVAARHRVRVASTRGIEDGESDPFSGVSVTLGLVDQTLQATTDAEGKASFELDSLPQHAALKLRLVDAATRLDARGLVKLRTGIRKEESLDDGTVPTVAAPRDGSTSQVARQVLEFLAGAFSEDGLAFPRTVSEDKRGPLESNAAPLLTEIVAWRLAKAAGDKTLASTMKSLLPLSLLDKLTKASAGDPAADPFDSFEIPIALAIETGDMGWLAAARAHIARADAKAAKPWCESMARSVLAAWRVVELADDGSARDDARRRTAALIAGITASEEPAMLSPTGQAVPDSGAASPHAWAALALLKASEMDGDAKARQVALAQVDHLIAKHIVKGIVGYSHLCTGERPGQGISQTEGAHGQEAAAVQALLLAHMATGDKKYHQAAMEVRARVLRTWRKDYGGFGRLDYWDAPVEGGDPAGHLVPIAARRQASIYQQSWALTSFLPIFYPYWGEGIPEDKPHWKLLDLLPLRWLRKQKESEE